MTRRTYFLYSKCSIRGIRVRVELVRAAKNTICNGGCCSIFRPVWRLSNRRQFPAAAQRECTRTHMRKDTLKETHTIYVHTHNTVRIMRVSSTLSGEIICTTHELFPCTIRKPAVSAKYTVLQRKSHSATCSNNSEI